jgi:hypothetical protein
VSIARQESLSLASAQESKQVAPRSPHSVAQETPAVRA